MGYAIEKVIWNYKFPLFPSKDSFQFLAQCQDLFSESFFNPEHYDFVI